MYLKTIAVSVLVFSVGIAASFQAEEPPKDRPQPESIGVFYWLDPAGKLLPLERKVAVAEKRGYIKEQVVVRLDGEKSDFRIESAQKTEFIIALPNGIDPNKYRLYIFNINKGRRELILAQSTMTGAKSGLVQVQFNVSKFGDAYKFSPAQTLAAGEYGFFPNDSNDAACFGIDAPDDADSQPK